MQPPANVARKRPGETCTPDEVRALMRSCSRGATGARNRALIATLWRAGLRVGEALELRPADLDPAAGLVRIRGEIAKGGKARAVGLDPEAFGVIEAWAARRSALGINGHAPLFCTLHGGILNHGYVRALFKRLARRAGIRHRVHPHALRHTFACELLREHAPLNLVQAALGHASLATTSVYLQHVTPQDLAERARSRASWTD